MALSLRSVATIALVLPLIAWKCGPDEGETPPEPTDASTPDGGGPDEAPANDGGLVDARGVDAGGEDAGSDSGADAGDIDGGAADAGEADAGGADAGGTDAGGTDAGNATHIVFLCSSYQAGNSALYWMIDTKGGRWTHVASYGVGPKAGGPVPANASAFTKASPVVDLSKLLDAAAAMEVSTAGSTKTTSPPAVGITTIAEIYTAFTPAKPTLVASYINTENGANPRRETIYTNDPAWQELEKYNCSTYLGTSHWK